MHEPPQPTSRSADSYIPERLGATSRKPRRVLFIGGLGRSGSTVLAMLLNSLPGFFSVGELRLVWLYARQPELLCSCGRPFAACEFWSTVGEKAFGGWDPTEAERMIGILRLVDRHRFLPLLRYPALSARFERRLQVYRTALAQIYDAVLATSDSDVIVDSTKVPPFAYVVRGLSETELRLVHLVRDSRGVAYSWTKHKARPEVVNGEEWMDRYSSLSSSLRWIDCNLLMHSLVRTGAPGLLLRYEDLVERPHDALRKILVHAGMTASNRQVDELFDGESAIAPNHSIAGNPVRFHRGSLRLRLDDEWRVSMRPRDRILVSALTAPLLWRYRYLPRMSRSGVERQGKPMG